MGGTCPPGHPLDSPLPMTRQTLCTSQKVWLLTYHKWLLAALIVDAMVIVQGLSNRYIRTCQDLAGEFLKGICTRSEGSREAHIVFDHYETTYLKNARCKNPGQRSPEAAYSVCFDSTPVRPTLKGFLSSVQTKHYLTTYIAEKLINPIDSSATTFIVFTSQGVLSTKSDISCLETTHEEADEIIIL